jgi:hypothetical protein
MMSHQNRRRQMTEYQVDVSELIEVPGVALMDTEPMLLSQRRFLDLESATIAARAEAQPMRIVDVYVWAVNGKSHQPHSSH